ncbi:MAG TPA: hypothetical protein VM866_01525 [Pyrinomonadaceae bacterium]|nr:hypothetical protein [Pyrinomonadaceae bacterium]
MQQQSTQGEVEKRYRILLIIWAAILLKVGILAVVSHFAKPDALAEDGESHTVLLMVLLLLGISSIVMSFIVKNMILARAANRRRLDSVQVAYVVAFALCETAALFGVVGLFATGESFSYIMFVVGAVGLMLHLPRRDHLLAAAYK